MFGTKSCLIKPLGLSPVDMEDLVAFVESLSGSKVKTDIPELPDYAERAVPQITALLAAASLKGSTERVATVTKDAIAPVATALADPAASTGGCCSCRKARQLQRRRPCPQPRVLRRPRKPSRRTRS